MKSLRWLLVWNVSTTSKRRLHTMTSSSVYIHAAPGEFMFFSREHMLGVVIGSRGLYVTFKMATTMQLAAAAASGDISVNIQWKYASHEIFYLHNLSKSSVCLKKRHKWLCNISIRLYYHWKKSADFWFPWKLLCNTWPTSIFRTSHRGSVQLFVHLNFKTAATVGFVYSGVFITVLGDGDTVNNNW